MDSDSRARHENIFRMGGHFRKNLRIGATATVLGSLAYAAVYIYSGNWQVEDESAPMTVASAAAVVVIGALLRHESRDSKAPVFGAVGLVSGISAASWTMTILKGNWGEASVFIIVWLFLAMGQVILFWAGIRAVIWAAGRRSKMT